MNFLLDFANNEKIGKYDILEILENRLLEAKGYIADCQPLTPSYEFWFSRIQLLEGIYENLNRRGLK